MPAQDQQQQDHIQVPQDKEEKDPNAPSGILHKGLDPVGKTLGAGLSPVGALVGGVTKPVTGLVGGITRPVLAPATGEAEERAEIVGGKKKAEDFGDQSGKERFGGKDQTGGNPLGL